MPFCQNCETRVLEGVSFCPICGFDFSSQWANDEVNQFQQQRYQQNPQQLHPLLQHSQPKNGLYQGPYDERYQQTNLRFNGRLAKSFIVVAIVFAVAAIIILSIAASIILNVNENGKTVIMSMREFDCEMDDYDLENGEFISMESGDTLKIEDRIVYIDSVVESGETVTYIWFKTNHEGENIEDWVEFDPRYGEYYYDNYDITFKDDLTNQYEIGDDVVVTLHIIEIEYNNRQMEYFEEMWDEQKNEPQYHIPSSCLNHA